MLVLQREESGEIKEVVLIPRVELGTSPLPRVRSAEPYQHLERAAGIEPIISLEG